MFPKLRSCVSCKPLSFVFWERVFRWRPSLISEAKEKFAGGPFCLFIYLFLLKLLSSREVPSSDIYARAFWYCFWKLCIVVPGTRWYALASCHRRLQLVCSPLFPTLVWKSKCQSISSFVTQGHVSSIHGLRGSQVSHWAEKDWIVTGTCAHPWCRLAVLISVSSHRDWIGKVQGQPHA